MKMPGAGKGSAEDFNPFDRAAEMDIPETYGRVLNDDCCKVM